MASSTMQEPSVQEFLSTKSELQLRNYLVKNGGRGGKVVSLAMISGTVHI